MSTVPLFGFGIRSGVVYLDDAETNKKGEIVKPQTVIRFKVNAWLCDQPGFMVSDDEEEAQMSSMWSEVSRYARAQLRHDQPDHPAAKLHLSEFNKLVVPPSDFDSMEEMEGVGKGEVGMMDENHPLGEQPK